MILKLTRTDGLKLLVNTTSSYFVESKDGGSWVVTNSTQDVEFKVKETIEEITQQIKEGGVCGTK
jgi:hypothetical protein